VEQGLAGQRVILETSRLRLREFVPQDADALAAVLSDPVAMQYYPAAVDRKGVEEWIERNRERYQREGYGLWAMVLKGSGELIGDCGCFLRDIEGRDDVEIGYHVRRDLWGRGYATEAADACMQYAFTKLGFDRVISLIRPENLQSIRVAEKNGLTCQKVIFWRGYEHCIYAIDVQTWHRRGNFYDR
jgi:RimJ/RimL family protein N-acetyltransferase